MRLDLLLLKYSTFRIMSFTSSTSQLPCRVNQLDVSQIQNSREFRGNSGFRLSMSEKR